MKDGTLWVDRTARLVDCVAQLKGTKKDDKWKEQYAEFERCVEMPAKGNKLHNWKQIQLSNGPSGLIAMIQKEITENTGSSVGMDRKARLLRFIAQTKVSWEREKERKWDEQ